MRNYIQVILLDLHIKLTAGLSMDGVISEGVRGVAGVWGVDTLACGWDSVPWPSYVGEVSPVAWLVLVPPNIGLYVGETIILEILL